MCEKFCKGGRNGKSGLVAEPQEGMDLKTKMEIFKGHPEVCPIGCTSNPKTKEATKHAIKNSGAWTVCHGNPWRY